MVGMYLNAPPQYINEDIFFSTLFVLWNQTVPRKSGQMADSFDYIMVGRGAYFWSDLIYANYQDQVTRYAGYFSVELVRKYNWLLSVWSDIDNKEET